jgi:hypothetical protein
MKNFNLLQQNLKMAERFENYSDMSKYLDKRRWFHLFTAKKNQILVSFLINPMNRNRGSCLVYMIFFYLDSISKNTMSRL